MLGERIKDRLPAGFVARRDLVSLDHFESGLAAAAVAHLAQCGTVYKSSPEEADVTWFFAVESNDVGGGESAFVPFVVMHAAARHNTGRRSPSFCA